jgi:transposase-like protein
MEGVMQAEETTLLEWQRLYGTEEACIDALVKKRWPDGFICPYCGHDDCYLIQNRRLYQCKHCDKQTSVTAGTVFHSTNLPLTKWFWAIYLMTSDKGGISAERLRKHLDVSWVTAYRMLRKLRRVMGDRNQEYTLSGVIELDDALVGGTRRGGKRGRGAEGKTPVLVAVENQEEHAGFIAMEATDSVNAENVKKFVEQNIAPDQTVRSDGLAALNVIGETQQHEAKVTPPEQASVWLPWVHIVISLFKRFLMGTFHGVSAQYLPEYLQEFCYRFNRRQWEGQIPHRLLNICIAHKPIQWAENC